MLGSFSTPPHVVKADDSCTMSRYATVPESTVMGTYTVMCEVDVHHVVRESDTTNNVATSGPISFIVGDGGSDRDSSTVPTVDLLIEVPTDALVIGAGWLSVSSFSVLNNGTTATPANAPWYDAMLLSADDELDLVGDIVLHPPQVHALQLQAGDR